MQISQTDEEIRASKSLLNPNYRSSEGKKKKVSRKKEKHKHKLQASRPATTLQKTLFSPPSPTTTRDTKESRELKIPLQKEKQKEHTTRKRRLLKKQTHPWCTPLPQKKKEKRNRKGLRENKKTWQRKLTDLTILWQIQNKSSNPYPEIASASSSPQPITTIVSTTIATSTKHRGKKLRGGAHGVRVRSVRT
jgi:hypothetical protein